MSHYYLLECPPLVNEKGEALMEISNCFRAGNIRSWCDGKEPRADTVFPAPLEIEFETFHGYAGPPRELVDVCITLMSKRLADTLVEAGVSNIVFYPTTLKNKGTGEVYDYRAFKVVGLVAAADLEKSKWESYDNKPVADTSFEDLVIDESKATGSGLLMFRLAENFSALVVHEKIRDAILAKGINTLKFIEPKDWVHA
ncbi:MAG: hypothetical protein A2675_01355 [Candidatus Yonathbacteria bacterium RIFCSPHIGHO2_01_FULL_51_10]|uniref:Immunity MXAN-0049 protein domain-containing protein n=1 Tax=Candidatus Yonathbacteria bacterium RIFCSPHIGHO2_01_FULL_51_10 TaxID=1802723 RepID=A0A1G2S5K3_9BACT|nr:MAG: hypothetical protein A2675_01355 [Candidatus Yonathbacteria bacterium RIFCSPHIGHO2_01_FULL_51_10]